MIEKDLGADVARAVARQLAVYHWRAGGQSQFSALLELAPKSDRQDGVRECGAVDLVRCMHSFSTESGRRIANQGYLIAEFSLVWVANIHMSLFGRLRLDLKRERIEVEHTEKSNGQVLPPDHEARQHHSYEQQTR